MPTASISRTRSSQISRYACLSCRQRKLKCDRAVPCSNCAARSVDCKQQEFSSSTRIGGIRKSPESQFSIPDIVSRLDQIEAFINRMRAQENDSHCSSPAGNVLNVPDANALLGTSSNVLPDSGGESESIRRESGRMITISANDSILNDALSQNLSLSVSSSATNSPASGLAVHECQPGSPSVQLPPKKEAIRYLQIYLDYVGHFQRILFEPHTRKLIDNVYDQVGKSLLVTVPNGSTLIFSILSISVLLEPLHGSLGSSIQIMRERLKICAVYIRATMDCLEHARRRMDHTFENLQAMVILTFLISHIEAFSARYRTLIAETIAVARILNIHQLDSSRGGRRNQLNDSMDPIVLEMKRRVWWYLVATDWMVTLAGGPGDSIYQVQPKHMEVNLPRHVNDDELANLHLTEQRLSHPTTMTYNLHRIKIAELARGVSDTVPNDPNKATYRLISSLDSKFEQFITELPPFFRMNKVDSAEVQQIDDKYPYIPIQRLIITIMVNLARCKLHLPYLVGCPDGALHIFSRDICLKSARSVLAAHQDMSTADLSHSSDFMKIQGTMQHMFMGAIILATDLCCNRPRGEEQERQSAELMRTCTVLAGVRDNSQLAAKFLESITNLLVKYGVWLSSATLPGLAEGTPVPIEDASQQWQLSNYVLNSGQLGQSDFDMPLLFDDLWETFVERSSAMEMIDIF